MYLLFIRDGLKLKMKTKRKKEKEEDDDEKVRGDYWRNGV